MPNVTAPPPEVGGPSPRQLVEQALNNPLPTIDGISSRTDVDISQEDVENGVAEIASSQTAMNAIAAEEKPANRASVSQVGMTEIAASQTAMNVIAASQTAMNEIDKNDFAVRAIMCGTTTQDPTTFADADAISQDSAAMAEIAGNQTTMNTIAASQTAMGEIGASQTAMQEVAASQTAMNEIDKNDFAVRAIMCGTTTQDPTAFADADAISQDSAAMAEIAGNQTTMNTIAASQTAMGEIGASQTAMQEVAASQTAMGEIAASQSAMKPVVESGTAVVEVLNNNNAIDEITSSVTAISAIQSTSDVDNRNEFFSNTTFQSNLVTSRPADRKVTWSNADSNDFSGSQYALTGDGIGGSTGLRYNSTNSDAWPDPSLLEDTSLGDGIPYVQEVRGGSNISSSRGRIVFNTPFESLDGDIQIEFGNGTSALQARDAGTDLDTINTAGTFIGYIVYPHSDGSVDVIVTEDGSLKGRMSTTNSIAEPPKTDYTFAYSMNTVSEELVVFDAR